MPAELQGRTEENCTNCSWPRNPVLAITIQLFNANKSFLDPPFAVIQLSYTQSQTVKDMHTCIDTELLKSSVLGNTAVLRLTHCIFPSGSTTTAAQALPLPQLIYAEPYFKANPPSRERGTRLGRTACFQTCMDGCCTSERQTPEGKHKVNLREPLYAAVEDQDGLGCYGKGIYCPS